MQKTRRTSAAFLALTCLFIINCGSAAIPIAETPTAPAIKIEPVTIPNAAITYYDITGSTESELRDQLNTLGPVGYDGYRGDATTHWSIRWNWLGYGTSSCDLSSAEISYEIEVTFPRWTPPGDASHDLIKKWAAYNSHLAEHEKGHVDHILENFPMVVDAIKNGTCEMADANGNVILEQLRQYDIDYDTTTDHGATQGARFP